MSLRDTIETDLAEIELELSCLDSGAAQVFTLTKGSAPLTADSTTVTADDTDITADQTIGPGTSVDIPCSPSRIGRTNAIDPRGNALEIDLRLLVRRKAFLQSGFVPVVSDGEVYIDSNDELLPLTGRVVMFRGSEFRILQVTEAPTKSHFELMLGDAASNQ